MRRMESKTERAALRCSVGLAVAVLRLARFEDCLPPAPLDLVFALDCIGGRRYGTGKKWQASRSVQGEGSPSLTRRASIPGHGHEYMPMAPPDRSAYGFASHSKVMS